MKFAIASEGVTDQITIENILCGFFEDENLDEDIIYLQPPFDKTKQKQASNDGGWSNLFRYLKTPTFRYDVLNHTNIIIQIDTDVSPRKSFDVKHEDKNGNKLNTNDLVHNVIDKLTEKIEQGKSGFYQQNSHKIIFCICVHSLECWLLAYHCEIIEVELCLDKLSECLGKKVQKKYKIYNRLSQPFLEKHKLLATAENDKSLNIFLDFIAEQT
ncbi:hypothetical protein QUF50_07515 [Thiotrichales bacterium HSG1]|nr:hypothetical protein [Thiotrichales bacterium HSG1]